MIWMSLVLFYGILKGAREFVKKEAMKRNSVIEVLVAYTVLSFVFVIPQAPSALGMNPKFFVFVALKSFVIFLAWIFGFYSLRKLPVSLFGILDLSRVLFNTFTGVFFLNEVLKTSQILGLVIVCLGLLLLKFKPEFLKKLFHIENGGIESPEQSRKTAIYVTFALLCCMLNAVSGFMDKILMKDITSSQLQFWYTLFLMLFYLLYVLFMKIKLSPSVIKNWWIWLLALLFVTGEKALFTANGMADSKITIMTLIKQSSAIVTIFGGKLIYKEKNTAYRFFCAAVIIAGIVIGIIK